MNDALHITEAGKTGQGPGRPREFDEGKALETALQVFWQKGYEGASLEDLTTAMGLSRSSFYGTFSSKQRLFQRALAHYSRNGLKNLQEVADTAEEDPLGAMLEALSNPEAGSRGCMLINCVTALAPNDAEVARIGKQHLEAIEETIARAIDPQDPDAARDKASAYASLAIGTLALRKAGFSEERIAKTLAQARPAIGS